MLERFRDTKPFDTGRRNFLKGAAATTVLALGSPVLLNGEGDRTIENAFNRWRFQEPDVRPHYGPEGENNNWDTAINLLPEISRTGDIEPYHRATTLWSTRRACRGTRYSQIETDLQASETEGVYVAHTETDYWDMRLDDFHRCVGSRVFNQGRFKLIKYDFKSHLAFEQAFQDIEQFHQGRPYIMNTDAFKGYRGEGVDSGYLEDLRRLHPNVIWSSGNPRLGEDLDDLGPVLTENIKAVHKALKGNFTYAIQASDYRKYHKWLTPLNDAGVVFTIYKGNTWPLENGERVAIMNTLKPWQVVLDCK